MTKDARFEDGVERPLNLGALDADDLNVISALVQDAVLTGADLHWDTQHRRLSLLVNRVRWEDVPIAERRQRAIERTRSLLMIENVMNVASQGVKKGDKDTVLSLLSLAFEPGEDGTGHLMVSLAGDGGLRCGVEALEVSLKDVTRPYRAPSGKLPTHPE